MQFFFICKSIIFYKWVLILKKMGIIFVLITSSKVFVIIIFLCKFKHKENFYFASVFRIFIYNW